MSTKKNVPNRDPDVRRSDIEEVTRPAADAAFHKSGDDLHLGGHGKDGDLFVHDEHNEVTVHIDGSRAAILLGGHGRDGDVILSDGDGNETIHLDGKSGEVRIRDWTLRVPDFVFESDYSLRSMDDVHAFIEAHGHLPDVPSAREVQREGVDVARFSMTLLQKIEELTLYALDQARTLREQSERIAALETTLGFESKTRGHSC